MPADYSVYCRNEKVSEIHASISFIELLENNSFEEAPSNDRMRLLLEQHEDTKSFDIIATCHLEDVLQETLWLSAKDDNLTKLFNSYNDENCLEEYIQGVGAVVDDFAYIIFVASPGGDPRNAGNYGSMQVWRCKGSLDELYTALSFGGYSQRLSCNNCDAFWASEGNCSQWSFENGSEGDADLIGASEELVVQEMDSDGKVTGNKRLKCPCCKVNVLSMNVY